MKYKFWLVIIILLMGFRSPDIFAQVNYTFTLANDSLAAPNVYEFDIYMLNNDTSEFQLAGFNFGFLFNPEIKDTGTIKVSWVPNSSQLENLAQLPRNFKASVVKRDSGDFGIIIVGPRIPPGHGNGSIISNKGMGTKVGRLRLTCNTNYNSARMNIKWNFGKTNGLYPTTIAAYIKNWNTNVTVMGKYESKLVNPVL